MTTLGYSVAHVKGDGMLWTKKVNALLPSHDMLSVFPSRKAAKDAIERTISWRPENQWKASDYRILRLVEK